VQQRLTTENLPPILFCGGRIFSAPDFPEKLVSIVTINLAARFDRGRDSIHNALKPLKLSGAASIALKVAASGKGYVDLKK
jgi:hypothetical protein